jgi:hypothetical protein
MADEKITTASATAQHGDRETVFVWKVGAVPVAALAIVNDAFGLAYVARVAVLVKGKYLEEIRLLSQPAGRFSAKSFSQFVAEAVAKFESSRDVQELVRGALDGAK